MTPATWDGMGTLVLSVSTSATTSSTPTLSPTAFSHRRSPSDMDSANAGHTITCTSSLSVEDAWRPRRLKGPPLWLASATTRRTHGLRPWEPQKFRLLTCPSRPRIESNLETADEDTENLLLAAFAMGLEQSPLLATTASGEDNMIDVAHKAEERPNKAQDKIRCTSTLFFRQLM